MFAAFALFAPWAWRRLPPLTYVLGCTTLVGLLAVVLPRALHMKPTLLTDAVGLPITLVLFIVGGWGLGRDVELERSVEDAKLLALRAQLDPHFLFNTLNAIAEWCREDPEVAEQATLKLSAMMRVVFEGVHEDRWPLRREIALAEDLWALHRIRDPRRFDVRLEVQGELDDVMVPPMLLLPLAENAMTHGGAGTVVLRVERGEAIEVMIESPGAMGRPSAGGGHGIASVRKRLTSTWGRAASLSVGPAEDRERTRAIVRLPA
jgi:LytS/YehU family sensor histidine kinase